MRSAKLLGFVERVLLERVGISAELTAEAEKGTSGIEAEAKTRILGRVGRVVLWREAWRVF